MALLWPWWGSCWRVWGWIWRRRGRRIESGLMSCNGLLWHFILSIWTMRMPLSLPCEVEEESSHSTTNSIRLSSVSKCTVSMLLLQLRLGLPIPLRIFHNTPSNSSSNPHIGNHRIHPTRRGEDTSIANPKALTTPHPPPLIDGTVALRRAHATRTHLMRRNEPRGTSCGLQPCQPGLESGVVD